MFYNGIGFGGLLKGEDLWNRLAPCQKPIHISRPSRIFKQVESSPFLVDTQIPIIV